MDDSFFAANLKWVRDRVAAAAARSERSVDEITLVAISTSVPMDAIRAARRAGLLHFGERRVEDWEDKRADLGGLDATWHFIGQLQNDKAKRAAQLFHRVDSLDSVTVTEKLNEAVAGEKYRKYKLEVLIEVNLSADARQSGVSEADLPALAEALKAMPNLELVGLMTNPPYSENNEEARPYFERLLEARYEMRELTDLPLRVLSMGTSRDFEIAIEEGATEIRLGRALFGEREA